jgi:microcystin-dependent protein
MAVTHSDPVQAGNNARAYEHGRLRNDIQAGWIKPQYNTSGDEDAPVYAIETWTYASATTITVPTGATERYQKGDKIRLKQGGAYKYFTVTTVASTLLTITSKTYTLTNDTITDNYVSKFENPVGFEGVGGGVPVGGIIAWSGTIANIPGNWALCDGNNGTPNLKAKFLVGAEFESGGAGNNTTSYNVGHTGGENTHTLTTDEMPSHTHTQNSHAHTGTNEGGYARDGGGAGTNVASRTAGSAYGVITGSATATNQNTGGGASHENRPPYYALAWIMRIY